MKKAHLLNTIGITLLAVSLNAPAEFEYTEQEVLDTFTPYRDSVPTFPGYEPGTTVIDQSNADQFKEILVPHHYDNIKAGWMIIRSGLTTSFDLHPNYFKATMNAVKSPPTLNADGLVENFVAGRAFPKEPDLNDPRAGLKMAWNYQYGYNWGDNGTIGPFWWSFKNMDTGKVERVIKFDFHFLNWMHRVNQDPTPEFKNNPSKLFRSIYARVLEPFDIKDTQLLIHRYKNDLKRDDAWLYLGFQRRVRRLATGQTTDSFLGTDIMIEDFEGYNGRVSDYNWEYAGVSNMMTPFYNHNEQDLEADIPPGTDGYRFIKYEGEGGCFPKVTYQLRKTYTLIGTPKDPNHPLMERRMYIDAQTYTMPALSFLDRKGEPWKQQIICQAHSDHHLPINKGVGVSIDDCAHLVDVQARHCTSLQFKGILDAKDNPPQMFTVQNLRKRGQ